MNVGTLTLAIANVIGLMFIAACTLVIVIAAICQAFIVFERSRYARDQLIREHERMVIMGSQPQALHEVFTKNEMEK